MADMEQTPNPVGVVASPVSRVDSDPRVRFTEAIKWAEDAGSDQVKFRVELRLYNPAKQSYVFWPDANWNLQVRGEVEHGMLVQTAFDVFVRELTEKGPAAVIASLAE